MKSAGYGLRLLVLLLVLGIAGREAPEYASLSDDTSNDGELAVWDLDAIPEITLTRPLPCDPEIPPAKFALLLPPNRIAPIFSGSPTVGAGSDLLHRLALQRK